MPPRDPRAIQLDFPLLNADLISDLNLIGALGLLNFIPEVRPVFIIGQRAGALTVTADEVVYAGAEVFSGRATNPAANAVITDTGALPAGDYDIQAMWSAVGTPMTREFFELQHRNAANAANISNWQMGMVGGATVHMEVKFSLEVALNERFRFLIGQGLTGVIGATIMIKIRPVP